MFSAFVSVSFSLTHFSPYPSMASSFLTLPKPFLCSPNATFSPSHRTLPGLRNNSFRVDALVKKMEPTKVVPQADRVLVRLDDPKQKTAGGVLLPTSSVKFERYLMGEILSVGAEVQELEPGKKVIFSDLNAYEVDMGTDAKHCFCKASDLLATVE